MLKVTKVQPIATRRDYTRKDKGNFQEVYCKAQDAQAGDYRAAQEALKNYHGSLVKLHDDSIALMGRIGITRGVAEFLLKGLVDHDKC